MTRSETKINSIILVETNLDLGILDTVGASSSVVAVAFSAVLHDRLKKIGWPVILVDHLFKEKEHAILAETSEALLQHVIASMPTLADKSLMRLAQDDLVYQVGKFINQLICYELILRQLMKKYPRAKFVCSQSNTDLKLNIAHDDRLLGKIVGSICAEQIRSYRMITLAKTNLDLRSSPLRFARGIRTLTYIQGEIARIFFQKRKILLVSSPSYQLDKVADEITRSVPSHASIYISYWKLSPITLFSRLLNRKFFRFFGLEHSSREPRESKYEDEFKTFHQVFGGDKFPVSSGTLQLLGEFIAKPWKFNLTVLEDRLALSRDVVRKIQPKMFVSQVGVGISGALSRACNEVEIPTLLVSHGSCLNPSHPGLNDEWRRQARILLAGDFSILGVQSDLSKDVTADFAENNKDQRIINLRPVMWELDRALRFQRDQIRAKLGWSRDKFVLLHASTPRHWNHFFPFIYETTGEYLQNVKDLCHAVKTSNDLHLAIRTRPKDFLDWMSKKSPH